MFIPWTGRNKSLSKRRYLYSSQQGVVSQTTCIFDIFEQLANDSIKRVPFVPTAEWVTDAGRSVRYVNR